MKYIQQIQLVIPGKHGNIDEDIPAIPEQRITLQRVAERDEVPRVNMGIAPTVEPIGPVMVKAVEWEEAGTKAGSPVYTPVVSLADQPHSSDLQAALLEEGWTDIGEDDHSDE